MRIIGSSRIDDYKKLSMEDNVLKSIDAKPGDSVLFYRKENDDSVCIYRAEGATITTEADAPRRRHMREAYERVRLFLLIAAVASLIRLIITVFNYNLLGPLRFVETFGLGLLTLSLVIASIFITQIVDKPYDAQALVTVGNTYSKNRLTGISKLTTDGYVATGNLYINSLFGANPVSVEVNVMLETGVKFDAVVNEVKSVPGYCVHRIHMKEEVPSSGTFVVTAKYRYLGKIITVHSNFDMIYVEGEKDIILKEGPVEATIEFDQTLNDTEFDESWMSSENDMY